MRDENATERPRVTALAFGHCSSCRTGLTGPASRSDDDVTTRTRELVENLAHAVSHHYMRCNFARPQQTLTERYGKPTTSAMAAGVAQHVWSVWEIAGLLD